MQQRTYQSDLASFEDRFLPQVQAIVGQHLLKKAPPYQDQMQATDLCTLELKQISLGVRLRDSKYVAKYGKQVTFRLARKYAETEFSKIMKGWGSHFFYGFVDQESQVIIQWVLIDLNLFRYFVNQRLYLAGSKSLAGIGVIGSNHDKSSTFLAVRIADLEQLDGCVIAKFANF